MAQLPPAAFLALSLGAIAWSTWRGRRDYASFKSLTETADRQRRYRAWIAKGALLYLAWPIAVLALLGDLGCLLHEPKPFFGLIRTLRAWLPIDLGPAFLGGLAGGGVIAGALLVLVLVRRRGRPARMLGDIAPLMPRNWAETGWTALLSLNAGVSEEVFFRLMLPLLLAELTGAALIGFIFAGVIFGLAHLYQGWIGIIATGALGALFSLLYLWTGSLVAPIALHVFIDLMGLVVRPTISRLATPRTS